MSYTANAELSRQHPGTTATNNPAGDSRKQQCEPNETKPNAITINPPRRHSNPKHEKVLCSFLGAAVPAAPRLWPLVGDNSRACR